METMLPALAAIALGLTSLVWGADRFVTGSAGAARNLGISPLVIGLTVVSIGTSAPEIIVSINAALKSAGELAVGNALGSNLANIGLVLGITALVAPVPAQRHLLTQEGPTLLIITAWTGVLLSDGTLSRGECLPLLTALPLLLWATVWVKKKHPSPEEIESGQDIPSITMAAAVLWFCLGLGVMLLGSEALVWGATTVARTLGVSELIIGMTIVAIGTSLPELAASVVSAIRGHHDIAIGNVFGSNLFNLMAVLPIAGAISPMILGKEVFARDFAALASLTLLLYIAVAWARRPGTAGRHFLTRASGLVLLLGYMSYYLLLALPTG
jgi:cation:H+ antiporter